VRELRDRGEAGAAGALQVVGRRLRVQPAAERAFAREVPVARVLDHRTGRDLAELLVSQRKALDQCFHRGGEHVLVARLHVGAIGAREGDAGAAKNRDPA
jgi:hypothetical protein